MLLQLNLQSLQQAQGPALTGTITVAVTFGHAVKQVKMLQSKYRCCKASEDAAKQVKMATTCRVAQDTSPY